MLHAYKWDKIKNNVVRFNNWFIKNQHLLDIPESYLGDEINTYHFDWNRSDEELNNRFKILFSGSERYSKIDGNMAVPLFYEELHEIKPDWVIERIYFPDTCNDYKLLTNNDLWPLSLEGKIPPKYFNVICFSQFMTGLEPYIINTIEKAGIPLKWYERSEDDPIIIRGGASCGNPTLIKDICDIHYIGEGEEGLPELLELIENGLREGKTKEEILLKAANLRDGIWVPRFYEELILEDGTYLGVKPIRDDVPTIIKKDYVKDFNKSYIPEKTILGYSNFYLSNGIEISRGCIGKCSFCYGGFAYLPYRTRDYRLATEKTAKYKFNTGLTSVGLSAFCQASDPEIRRAMKYLYENVSDDYGFLSLRIDEFVKDKEYAKLAALCSRSKRVIFGVEGCSQKLRDAVSKHCTEEQLLETYRIATKVGFKKIKYMYIANLPGETKEDIEELLEFAKKLHTVSKELKSQGFEIPSFAFSFGNLKPNCWTPYQWAELKIGINPYYEIVKKEIEELGFAFHIVRDTIQFTPMIERCDGRIQDTLIDIANNIETCYELSDSEELWSIVNRHFGKEGVPDTEYWMSKKDKNYIFPWDFMDFGVKKSYLWKRYQDSIKQQPQLASKCSEACDGCGACDEYSRKVFKEYAEKREEDIKVDLNNLIPFDSEKPIATLEVIAEIDELHRYINPKYWENVLRKALNYSNIQYIYHSVITYNTYRKSDRGLFGTIRLFAYLKCLDGIDNNFINNLNSHSPVIKFVDYSISPITITNYPYYLTNEMVRTYTLELDKKLFNISKINKKIADIISSNTLLLPSLKKTSDEMIDVRPFIDNIMINNTNTETSILEMKIHGGLSVYQLASFILDIPMDKMKSFVIKKSETIH